MISRGECGATDPEVFEAVRQMYMHFFWPKVLPKQRLVLRMGREVTRADLLFNQGNTKWFAYSLLPLSQNGALEPQETNGDNHMATEYSDLKIHTVRPYNGIKTIESGNEGK
jgi:hypothetical protein